MGTALFMGLLVAAVVLFLAKRWISDDALQRLANAAAVVALIAAAVVFILPAAKFPGPGPRLSSPEPELRVSSSVPGPTDTSTATAIPLTPRSTDTPIPESTSTLKPTDTLVPESTGTRQTAVPPADASLGHTGTRPSDDAVMVYVPAGEFEMGSTDAEIAEAFDQCARRLGQGQCQWDWFQHESPQHPVTLNSFWIDQTEVSNTQYRLCVDAGACPAPEGCGGGQPTYDDASKVDHPVVCVNWQDATAYCNWVGGRLPTEAEWEYAARGADSHVYPWGDAFDGIRLNFCDASCNYEWRDTSRSDGYSQTAPANSFPNGKSWCGALNMAGNVGEWVSDWYGAYASVVESNPPGPTTGTRKILRGGSWYSTQPGVRCAGRSGDMPHNAYDSVGIRCALAGR